MWQRGRRRRSAVPQDELLSMMAGKRKREQEVEEMKARVVDEMAQTMDSCAAGRVATTCTLP